MVVTSVALAGTCLGSRPGPATTVVEKIESKATESAVDLRLVRNMLGRDNTYRDYGNFG